jgi:hypothetical protein
MPSSVGQAPNIIASLKEGFDITDEGEIDDYLGVKVTQPTKDTIKLRQPHLIQQILDEVGMLPQSKAKDKAAPSSTILCRDLDGSPFQEKWDYLASLASLTFWRSLLAQRLLTQCTSVLGLPATPGSPMLMPSSTSAGIYLAQRIKASSYAWMSPSPLRFTLIATLQVTGIRRMP